jgi:hypothetical protein
MNDITGDAGGSGDGAPEFDRSFADDVAAAEIQRRAGRS